MKKNNLQNFNLKKTIDKNLIKEPLNDKIYLKIIILFIYCSYK